MYSNYEIIPRKILAWYAIDGRRTLPWRDIESISLYKVLLSEFMLQQTPVHRVIDYYLEFIATWNSMQSLSNAHIDVILAKWSGLGLYMRAINMHKAVQMIWRDFSGDISSDTKVLLSIPGVGEYTAGAIRAFWFNIPSYAIDTNVRRVFSRVFAIDEGRIARRDKIIRSYIDRCVIKNWRLFYYAVMDFGSIVCTSSSPNCVACCLKSECLSYKEDKDRIISVNKRPKAKKKSYKSFFYIMDGKGRVFLIKNSLSSLWPGLLLFPSSPLQKNKETDMFALYWAPFSGKYKVAARFVYPISVYSLYVKVMVCSHTYASGSLKNSEGYWLRIEDVLSKPIPSIMRKIIYLVRDRNTVGNDNRATS